MNKILMATAAFALALGIGAASAAADKLKACWVYVGPVGDFGYSYQHDLGRKAVAEHYGDKVETSFVEKVAEGPDADRVIRQLAASGNQLIFATSFGFMNSAVRVAKQFPKVKFEHATGYQTGPNLAVYNARFYEGRAVIGTITPPPRCAAATTPGLSSRRGPRGPSGVNATERPACSSRTAPRRARAAPFELEPRIDP